MRSLTTLFLLALVSLFCCVTLSASQPARFFHLTVNDGLSQNDVQSIMQDQFGVMWFGTREGLNRYDGYNFTTYKYSPKKPNSLPHNFVRQVFEDSKGQIWIATDNGLALFERELGTFHRFQHDPFNADTIANNKVWAILEDNGFLWIATQNGLDRLNLETRKIQHFTHNRFHEESLSHQRIFSLFKDHKGQIWVGTDVGWDLMVKKGEKISFRRFGEEFIKANKLLKWGPILSMFEDKNGILWIGSYYGGLIRFDPETKNIIRFYRDRENTTGLSGNSVQAVIAEEDRLWVGTTEGLDMLDRKTGEWHHFKPNSTNRFSINDRQIHSFMVDRNGLLWIGTGGGISRFHPNSMLFRHITDNPYFLESISDKNVNAIFQDGEGIIWVGTNNGLNRWDRKTKLVKIYRNDPANPDSINGNWIQSINEDKQGFLWIGVKGQGLIRFDKKKETFSSMSGIAKTTKTRHISSNVWSIHRQDNDFWIGGDWQFSRYDPVKQTIKYYETPASVLVVKKGRDNKLWLGTDGEGLLLFDIKKDKIVKQFKNQVDKNSLSANTVWAIHEEKNGKLWIGTWGGGLNHFDPETERFRVYTEREGLPNNSVTAIVEDLKGHIWISTRGGLSRFSRGKAYFESFYQNDGIQSLEFNKNSALRTQSGELMFGGINGMNLFDPKNIKTVPIAPNVVIADVLKLDEENKMVSAQLLNPKLEPNEIRFGDKPSMIFIQFILPDYMMPEKNNFYYKMEGYDQDWIKAGSENRAVYTNLDQEYYHFRIKGENHRGTPTAEETTLKILVGNTRDNELPIFFLLMALTIPLIFCDLKRKKKS